MTDQHDPNAPPPRPTSFQAPRTPGLPQATPDRNPRYDGNGHSERSSNYDTPTRAMTGPATATRTDARGRTITARKLSLLDYYRLTKILGEASAVERSMDLASLAASVVEIDGDQVIFPATESELQFIMQRLDFDGVSAAGEALKSLNPNAGNPEDTAKN